MTTDRKIRITIPSFGAPKVEAIGFNGEGCTEATAMFEKALTSQPVEAREFKPEWVQPAEEGEAEQEHQSW